MSDNQPEEDQYQESEIFAIVNKEDFTTEVQKYYSGHNINSKKLEWTSQRIKNVIKLLDEYHIIKSQGKRPTNKHYHHARKYDVMNIGHQRVLILKRKDISDPIVQIISTEEYYQKILDVHIATRHGRRDKIVHALKDKYMVPIFAVTIFLKLCKTCLSKKSSTKKENFRQSVSDDINRRGKIDLLDFQTSPDREYKWLLQYQDHRTKFCILRPLKSNYAKEVAIAILKIFLEVGCPNTLESDDEYRFLESVIKELVVLWPESKFVNGIARYQQRKESIESSNPDIKNMVQGWMIDNKSTNWSVGCYFVQFQINSSYHSMIGQTPYMALFGHNPKPAPSASPCSSNNNISKIETEEDFEDVIEDIDNSKDDKKENIKRVAEEMLPTSSKKFKDLSINSSILVKIPKANNDPLDIKDVIGDIFVKKEELYQVCNPSNINQNFTPINSVLSSSKAELLGNIPQDTFLPLGCIVLPLNSAASNTLDGQQMKQCKCKSNNNGHCVTNKCNCMAQLCAM